MRAQGRRWCLAAILLVGGHAALAAMLTGKVVDEQGQPVAQATVWLYYQDAEGLTQELVATGASAADGTFTLEDAAHAGGQGDAWRLCAYAAGRAPDSAYVAEPHEAVELTLREPGILRGQIVDDQGRPVAGARVALVGAFVLDREVTGSFAGSLWLQPEVQEVCAARTDATGSFELRAAPRGWQASYDVSAPGYGELTVQARGGEAAFAPLRLERPGSVTGQITGIQAPDSPAGTRLSLRGELRGEVLSIYREATAGADGRFTFAELQPGTYDLSISKQPSDRSHVRAPRDLLVEPGGETHVELPAEPTTVVSGRVVADDTGEGLGGAEVRLAEYSEQATYEVHGQADAEGRFEIPCLQGQAIVDITPPAGYLSEAMAGTPGPAVNVGAVETVVEDIRLKRAQTLAITVVDEAGQPVADAAVRVTQQPDRGYFGNRELRTDEQGRCTAEYLPAGPATVRATKGDLASEAMDITVPLGAAPLTVVLKPGLLAGFTAVLVDQDGRPLTDAEVTLAEHQANSIRYPALPPPDNQGRLASQDLTPGLEYRLQLSAPHCFPLEAGAWTATAGQTHDLGTITLTRHTGFVAGVVVDEAGAPVAGAKVLNVGDAPDTLTVATGPDGRFRLEGLVEGTVYVSVEAPGREFVSVPVPTGTEDARITLRPEAPGTVGPPPPREPQVPPEEAVALALPLVVEALRPPQDLLASPQTVLGWLARVSPEGAVRAAAEAGLPGGVADRVVARQRLLEGSDEALAQLRETADPYEVAWDLCDAAAERVARGDADRARTYLAEALPDAASVPEPWRTAVLLAQIGDILSPLDPQAGAEALEQARVQAEGLALQQWEASVRGLVAERLAPWNLEGALALVEAIPDEATRARQLEHIAARLAGTDPDRALDLLAGLGAQADPEAHRAGVLPNFPPDQLGRGVELARAVTDVYRRAAALTALAARVPPQQAPELIEEAAAGLAAAGEQGAGPFPTSKPAIALAHVACAARRLGYDRSEALALRAAAIRAPGSGFYVDFGWNATDDLWLAEVLAFTSPALARHVIEATLVRFGGLEHLPPGVYPRLASAAAEADVRWALELLQQMRPDDPQAGLRFRAVAATEIARCLLTSAEEREAEVLGLEPTVGPPEPVRMWGGEEFQFWGMAGPAHWLPGARYSVREEAWTP